jgi:uncharacterized protein YjbJ (UPF0337 family)
METILCQDKQKMDFMKKMRYKNGNIIKEKRGARIMESIAAYFAANPEKFTMFAIFIIIMLLYFIMSKLIKMAIVVIAVVLIIGGVNAFKDPAPMSVKVKKTAETFVTGAKQMVGRLGDFWRDSKEVAGEVKKLPGDLNKELNDASDIADKNIRENRKK